MKLNIAVVLCATIFVTLYFTREAFGSDVYCFSCFGYDEDGHDKCHSFDTGDLHVRKCTTNTTCIEYTATYNVPQSIQGNIRGVPATVHGLHCGTHDECDRIECPNFWPKDIIHKNCEIKCCHPLSEKCPFPIPTKRDIDRYNNIHNKKVPGAGGDNGNDEGESGTVPSDSGVTRVSQSTWLLTVPFAIFGLFKL